MALQNLSPYAEKLESDDLKQYFLKLTLKSGERLPDPFTLPDKDWSDEMTNLPEISWRDVTDYLIDSPSIYTKERMKAYKSLQAYDFFICGHVQDCFYHEISSNNDFCFIKTEVRFNLTFGPILLCGLFMWSTDLLVVAVRT